MWILRVVEALRRARVSHAIAGGYAVALHGAIRGTIDLDVVLRFRQADFEKAEAALRSLRLMPRLPVTAAEVFRFREEYVRNRNLTAWSFVNPSIPSEIVDVILTHDLAKMKTKRVSVPGGTVTILAKDDLIRMKESAGRPQDREDVRALRALP